MAESIHDNPEAPRETWLVAAWPGMGNVGLGACGYLISRLQARLVHELDVSGIFGYEHVEVKDGLATPGQLPRCMLFEWSHPERPLDLLIFLGEAQPETGGYTLCERLLDHAQGRNISRVITFAAMATQLHPADEPMVFGIGTTGEQIRDLQSHRAKLLKEGQIAGLNGVLLAAAGDRRLPGLCLLGELPYFAAGVPNPKASRAVLEIFCEMADLTLEWDELNRQAEAVEKGLIELLGKLQDAAGEDDDEEDQFIVQDISLTDPSEEPVADDEAPETGSESENNPDAEDSPPKLDAESRRRVESLFEGAEKDRSRAVQLKAELDRLGVFKQYEDRFLDLFRKGE